MWELVNRERIAGGLTALLADSLLCDLAARKALDMCSEGYFGHRSPTLGCMSDMVRPVYPWFDCVGENIALNFPDDETVHRAWMNSSLHRKNIMCRDYTHFGYNWWRMPDGRRMHVQVFCGRLQFPSLQ